MADFATEIIEFDLPTGAAATTLDITSAGFGTPKFALFLVTSNIGTNATSISGQLTRPGLSYGATDGTRQWAAGVISPDNKTSDGTSSSFRSDVVVTMHEYLTNKGRWKSNGWITDGVQIEVVTQINSAFWGGTNAPKCTCILFNGDALDAYVGATNTPGNTTPKNLTGVGFLADGVLTALGSNDLNANGSTIGNVSTGLVLNDGSGSTWSCRESGQRQGAVSTRYATMRENGTILDAHWWSSGSLPKYTIDDFDSSGFTITSVGTKHEQIAFGYVAIKMSSGYSLDAASMEVPTSGDVIVNDLKLTPEFVLMQMSTGCAAWTTDYSGGTYLSGWGMSVFNSADAHSITTRADDGTDPTVTDAWHTQTIKTLNGNSTTGFESSSWTLDYAGYTLTASENPTVAFKSWAFTIGKTRPVTNSLLHLDGDIGGASVADSPVFDPVRKNFTFEFVATPLDIARTAVLVSNTASATTRSFQLDLLDDEIKLYLSSDSTTWDIANGVVVSTITASRFKLTIERIDAEFIVFLNGAEQIRIYSVADLAEGGKWTIGNYDSTLYFDGTVHAWRYMIDSYRYGVDHGATALPFADSDSYSAGIVYSTKPALMWSDMATSVFYGLGASTVGVIESTDWGDEILDDGVTPRCRLGLTISSPSRAEYWLDILANYANCVWYPDGGDLRIAPDQPSSAESPSGQDIVYNGIFDTI